MQYFKTIATAAAMSALMSAGALAQGLNGELDLGADAELGAEVGNGVGVDADLSVGAEAELGADPSPTDILGLQGFADSDALLGVSVFTSDGELLGTIDSVAVVDGAVHLTLVLATPAEGGIQRVILVGTGVTEADGNLVTPMTHAEFIAALEGQAAADIDQ